jgi:Serine/threonine protein kinase
MDKHCENFVKEFNTFLAQKTSLPSVITDNYDIYNCLHETDEKAIFLIKSKITSELYILKTCDRGCKEDVAEEYKLLKALNHEAIVKAVFYFELDMNKYLIREYADGKTLEQLVEENGTYDDKEAVEIVLQLCGIMRYLHLHHPPIIHRDIKPRNIIYSANHGCKLIDFGIARRYHNNAQKDTTYLGTENTAAPEQFGYKQTSTKSDIYSMGILLLYLLTGTFDIERCTAIKNKRLKKIVDKCVRFDPEDRYTSISHLSRSLKQALLRGDKVFRAACAGGLLALAVAFAVVGSSIFSGNPRTPDMASADQPSGTEISALNIPASIQPDGPVAFSSPLIEEAVRHELGLKETEIITQTDLDKVTKILICGTTVYDNWTDHSMIDAGSFLYGKPYEGVGTVMSLDDIAKMKNLTELALFNQRINDISALKGLKLTKLGLGGNSISDISILSEFPYIEELYLTDNPIRDLSPLSRLGALSVLDIGKTYVKDISPIAECPILSLSLADTPVQDYSPLVQLVGIQKLFTSGISPEQVDICASLSNLKKLSIWRSNISDIKIFLNLKQLTDLDLLGNNIESLNGIEQLNMLGGLVLLGNPVSDLTPVKDLNLYYINVTDIPAVDFDPLSYIKNLNLVFCSDYQRAAVEEACKDRNVQIIIQ